MRYFQILGKEEIEEILHDFLSHSGPEEELAVEMWNHDEEVEAHRARQDEKWMQHMIRLVVEGPKSPYARLYGRMHQWLRKIYTEETIRAIRREIHDFGNIDEAVTEKIRRDARIARGEPEEIEIPF